MDEEAENQPLLPRQRKALSAFSTQIPLHHFVPNASTTITVTSQEKAQRFLTSKAGHYFILILVTLDVLCIFSEFIIQLLTCESPDPHPGWQVVLSGLGITSLVFSSLFMTELLASLWAFGSSYFNSAFHTFDALVITASFIIDILLRGVLEEVASLVIVLRLWRVFKIIEELSVGAQEQMEDLQIRVETLEKENSELREEIERLKGN